MSWRSTPRFYVAMAETEVSRRASFRRHPCVKIARRGRRKAAKKFGRRRFKDVVLGVLTAVGVWMGGATARRE